MMLPLPRYVIAKPLASGTTGFYFTVPTRYREMGCTIPNEPLGNDYAVACGVDGKGGRAAALNGLFDEWWKAKNGEPVESIARYGTVDWLFREYKASERYKKRVSARTRPDYERLMRIVIDLPTKRGDRVGQRPVKAITPRAADKIYEQVCAGPNGPRPRQGEKVVALCRAAWRVVHRLYPDCFDRDVPNPWDGVTMEQRTKATKAAATREEVYKFAWGAIEAGRARGSRSRGDLLRVPPAAGECLGGLSGVAGLPWQGSAHRNQDQPPQDRCRRLAPAGRDHRGRHREVLCDAEAVLAHLPRRGIAMILKQRRDGTTEPYTAMQMSKIVRKLRDQLGLPSNFTLDACRHGGMTELEEAELTDGQGRALSGHRTQRAYEGYAKRTLERALPATRKRYAHAAGERSGNIHSECTGFGRSE